MKIQITLNADDTASARVVHKAFQSRTHGTKSGGHRYERRKVREHLRSSDIGAENAVELTE
jgi:hypothetical protein